MDIQIKRMAHTQGFLEIIIEWKNCAPLLAFKDINITYQGQREIINIYIYIKYKNLK